MSLNSSTDFDSELNSRKYELKKNLAQSQILNMKSIEKSDEKQFKAFPDISNLQRERTLLRIKTKTHSEQNSPQPERLNF